MAIYKIFPEKDASIYSQYPSMNTGIDEIIEFSTTLTEENTPEVSRALIKFAQSDINDIIINKISGSAFDSYLKLSAAKLTGLNREATIEVYPISGAWNCGTGKYLDSPEVVNGVSWVWKTLSGSNAWQTSNYNYFATASFNAANPGGGTWYTGSYLGLTLVASASLGYRTNLDLQFKVTNILQNWYSESIGQAGLPNDGFIVKQNTANEFNADDRVELKYFSIDTNTIYPPQLEFRWNDFSYVTSSTIQTITDPQCIIGISNNTEEYFQDSIQRFRLAVRPQFPPRVFQTSSFYTTNYYLPPTSYYSITDIYTNEVVIDFDSTYTKISADETGSFFDIYMAGLEPERYYKVLVKTTIGGTTKVIDGKNYFKVING